ncbi:MAG: sulfite exporter TauE/SafE family protein [Promethearchaeota archaeon]
MDIDLIIIILLLIFGFLIGNIATITGIGGGVMYVPTLVILLSLPFDIARGTSLFVILISSGAGFVIYLKDKRTNLKLTVIFGSFSIIGSILSTIIFGILIPIDNTLLRIIFALVLIFMGVLMLIRSIISNNNLKNSKELPKEISLDSNEYKSNLKKAIPLFIMAGFISNLIGIGGGVINTPSLHMVLGFSIHNSTAISTSIIFVTQIYNTIVNGLMELVDFLFGLLIGIGSVIGSITGAKISKKIPKVYLQFLISIVLVILAIRMFF